MPEVRQSSFALLGDLTKACFKHVKPCIGKLPKCFFFVTGFVSINLYVVSLSICRRFLANLGAEPKSGVYLCL